MTRQAAYEMRKEKRFQNMRSRCRNKLDQKLNSKLESMSKKDSTKPANPLNAMLQIPKVPIQVAANSSLDQTEK